MRGLLTIVLVGVLISVAACTNDARTWQHSTDRSEQPNALQGRRGDNVRGTAAVFDPAQFAALTNVDLAWGGLMYDRWWIADATGAMPVPPANLPADGAGGIAVHKSWPASNTQKTGITTWRCKSCHGWDYVGADGMYSDPAGSYYTGLFGIVTSANYAAKTVGNPAAIFDVISAGTVNGTAIPDHDFSTYITDTKAIYALTYFVNQMQVEAGNSRSPQTLLSAISSADQVKGYYFYQLPTPNTTGTLVEQQGGCAQACHGDDGTLLNLHPDTTDPHDVATFAQKDPFEVLHKIRFGHPTGIDSPLPKMPGLEWYPNAEIISETALSVAFNILAYAQNGLLADHAAGGRLYDNWVLETAGTAPADAQPLLQTRDPNPALPAIGAGAEWLCSSCHGYDYEGSGFANNLVELRDVRGWRLDYVYKYLKEGRYTWINNAPILVHQFGKYLNNTQLWNLAEFLMEGVTDTHYYLSLGLNGRALGKGYFDAPFNGKEYYYGNMVDAVGGPVDGNGIPLTWACNACHGEDGKGVATVDLYRVAWESPWRFFHRARFGMPGTFADTAGNSSRMPGLLELTLADTSGTPLAEDVLLPALSDRTMDVQTFAQDKYVLLNPATNLQAIQARTRQITQARHLPLH